jgi:hypothetical protein
MTLTKSALLGASDLVTREVQLPTLGDSVTVRSLPAAYSNQAVSEALEVVTGRRGEQTARVNSQKLEELQVLHGLVDPKLDTLEEVRALSLQIGAAWRKIVSTIDEISGIDKAAIERAEATFPAGGTGAGGDDLGDAAGAGNGRPDLPVSTGAVAGDADRGDV